MTNKTLLVELLTEELPPTSLVNLSKSFADEILSKLAVDSLTSSDSEMRVFATPRRIGFQITKIKQRAENSIKELKLLPKKIAFDEKGKPTELLKKKIFSLYSTSDKKKMISTDEDLSDFIQNKIQIKSDGKQEYLYSEINEIGIELSEALQTGILASIKVLPIPKVMTYQDWDEFNNYTDIKFIRPAHKLIVLHGEQVLKLKVLGLDSNQFSDGHRFLGRKNLKIDDANDYENQLQQYGKVIPNFDNRKSKILEDLIKKAGLDDLLITDELLNEITSLCEWPTVYEGHFDYNFLSIPHECLILTMQKNQKFIPLKTKKNKLSNRFLIVSNIFTPSPENIIKGNERVLKARLADAQFFFNLDRKRSLEENVPKLSKVIYHNKLGNIYDRTLRLVSLTSKWGTSLGLEKELCERAALLSKADLTSKMVDEFPELQGIIGKYYAEFYQEKTEVCVAIEEHYKPKFSGDLTSVNLLGNCLSLADRIESIVGLWSIGILPTGEKDPMGLRRHAIAVLRILIENKINLNLDDLIIDAAKTLGQEVFLKKNFTQIKDFFLDRLRNWLKDTGHQPANIESALSKCNNKIYELPEILKAINYFLSFPSSYDLCSTNKRIKNILKKNSIDSLLNMPDPKLFEKEAEIILFEKLVEITSKTDELLKQKMYKEVLIALSELKHPVDIFFENVLVNTNNEILKNNRISLLNKLNKTMNQVAEISLLVE